MHRVVPGAHEEQRHDDAQVALRDAAQRAPTQQVPQIAPPARAQQLRDAGPDPRHQRALTAPSGSLIERGDDDVRPAVVRVAYRHPPWPAADLAVFHVVLHGAAARAESTEEVAGLLRLASKHGVAVVPRGAGTGLSGGAAGIEGALTVALTRMNRILEIDRANLCVVTQPGVINADLKAAVAAEGLFYPPDPASYETCSIGGNLGTNAGGLCCVKYGQTRDSVLGLEVVLADGSVIRTGGRNVKDVEGYSLTHLFVGSQGTLGIITEAWMRIRPRPTFRASVTVLFGDFYRGADAVRALTQSGLYPSNCRLLDAEEAEKTLALFAEIVRHQEQNPHEVHQ